MDEHANMGSTPKEKEKKLQHEEGSIHLHGIPNTRSRNPKSRTPKFLQLSTRVMAKSATYRGLAQPWRLSRVGSQENNVPCITQKRAKRHPELRSNAQEHCSSRLSLLAMFRAATLRAKGLIARSSPSGLVIPSLVALVHLLSYAWPSCISIHVFGADPLPFSCLFYPSFTSVLCTSNPSLFFLFFSSSL